MSYLAQWVDPALEVSAEESVDKIVKEELERLLRLNAIATAAGQIPRRLGQDASSPELAVDKKRSRRIAHVALQLASAWSGKDPNKLKVKYDAAQDAAVVNWNLWWEEHRVWLINRQRYIATWASRQEDQARWCKSAMVRLNNETQWFEYALRD